jgi:hypothetical protein
LGVFILITIGIEGFDGPPFIQILNIIMIALSFFYIVAGCALLCVRVTPYENVQISKSVPTEKIIECFCFFTVVVRGYATILVYDFA